MPLFGDLAYGEHEGMLSPKFGSALAMTLALAPLPVFAQASTPMPTTAPSFAPQGVGEDPSVTTKAKTILHQMQTKTVDRGQFSDEFNRGLTQDKLDQAGTQLAAFGEPQSFTYDTKLQQGNVTAYLYHVRLQRGRFDEIIAVDGTGKVDGLLFRNALLTNGTMPGQPPAKQPPGEQPPSQQQPQGVSQ
jgi:hypothetical protein